MKEKDPIYGRVGSRTHVNPVRLFIGLLRIADRRKLHQADLELGGDGCNDERRHCRCDKGGATHLPQTS